MSVGIVISNYNYGRYVESSIESCLAQTVPCKIIVVDDMSTDNSWSLIRRYKGKVKAVQLASNSGGNARGKNVGIAMLNTMFITCLDSDDMLMPNSIELRLKAMGEADFCHGWHRQVSSDKPYKKIVSKFKNRKDKKTYHLDNKIKREKLKTSPGKYAPVIESSTVLARRSLYEELGLYDEYLRWGIDREMWWRWLSNGKKVSIIPDFVSVYRKHGANITMNPDKKKPKEVEKRYAEVRWKRKQFGVNASNTIMLENFDYKKHIGRVL